MNPCVCPVTAGLCRAEAWGGGSKERGGERDLVGGRAKKEAMRVRRKVRQIREEGEGQKWAVTVTGARARALKT